MEGKSTSSVIKVQHCHPVRQGLPFTDGAFIESDVNSQIASSPSITVHPISSAPNFLKSKSKLAFLVFGPLKVIFQMISLWVVLGYKVKPAQWMLVQVSCGPISLTRGHRT